MSANSSDKITIVRNRKCRKSDAIVRFLEQEKIPFELFYLGEEMIADDLARKYGILTSPGIIIGGKTVNPYDLVEHCKVKDPDSTKKLFWKLISGAESHVK